MVARLRKVVVVYGKNQVNTPIVTWQFGLKRTRAMRHLWIYKSRRKKSHFSLSVLIFLRYEWLWEILVSQTNGRFLIIHWKNSLNILMTKFSRFLCALTTELRESSGRYLVNTEWRWPNTNASSSVGLQWLKKEKIESNVYKQVHVKRSVWEIGRNGHCIVRTVCDFSYK